MGMNRGYPNSSEMGMGFEYSSPLNMYRITGKYLLIGYGDGEGETHPPPRLIVMPKYNKCSTTKTNQKP